MQETLGRKLRLMRAERGLSLREAARRAGVVKETISDIERGKTHPYDVTLAKLAEVYEVPLGELLEEPVPLAEAPSGRPSPKEEAPRTEAGQWDRVRKLSPQAKRGIRDYLKARGNKVSLKSPEGQRIKEGLIQAIKELDEGNPEIQEDRLESSNVLDRLEPISVLAFAQNAPPEVVADVLRDEDTQQVEASVMEGFVTVLLETVRTTDELFWQRLDDVGRAWRALSPSV
jgi:transcriptional regulator with XRE-family HTH domain